ncbi:hypothetical protein BO82DRAFT_126063 [Aspergillus uvarum CBS 121591]|uniref:Uncharacterized protein n=1 Tax=Aspergillus uvarum CBS 121591 TaxID=1448315 RepID=A0A319CM21_9EURO|nr:hypothetical protein BO82DRAFT_126063 [Aspergillus uvarum CBS 121591]PYH79703.1 hypothetical protein BO82DRAFT_126063 [Aspergillus uvarum CBS 121591]
MRCALPPPLHVLLLLHDENPWLTTHNVLWPSTSHGSPTLNSASKVRLCLCLVSKNFPELAGRFAASGSSMSVTHCCKAEGGCAILLTPHITRDQRGGKRVSVFRFRSIRKLTVSSMATTVKSRMLGLDNLHRCPYKPTTSTNYTILYDTTVQTGRHRCQGIFCMDGHCFPPPRKILICTEEKAHPDSHKGEPGQDSGAGCSKIF